MAENKVQFNLKNVHYARIKVDPDTGEVTFEAPVPIPGAVSLALQQVGEMKKFYADGIIFWQGTSNNGYEGDLEIARFPEKMLAEIWGMTKDEKDKVIVENVNDIQSAFALLFQIDGDKTDERYCLYNVSASRPSIEAATNEESKDPKPQKLSMSAAALDNGDVKASTSAETPDEVRKNWFKKVWQKTSAAA